jgi:polygalacturonase
MHLTTLNLKNTGICFFVSLVFLSNMATARSFTDNLWEHAQVIINSIQEPNFPDRDYIVTDFDADPSNVLPAVKKAIDLANKEGGGRVIIPEGEWISRGPIHMKSNINLHISNGGVLRFSENPDDYLPQVITRWEGTEVFNYSPLIYAYMANNVAISGHGTIEGNGGTAFSGWRPQQRPAQAKLREMGAANVPVHERVFGKGDYLRPAMIQFFGCSRVLIEDVTITESPQWVNHIIYSSHIIVRRITVNSHRLNNDGVALDSSTLALVEDNVFDTGDDSIVIKAGRDQDGWRIDRPSEDIVIRNNYMQGHNALAIGSEMSGGVRRVFMENNTLGNVRSAIYFKSNPDRGGYIEQVRVRNVRAHSAREFVRFQTDYHSHRGEFHPTLYRDFVIENVTVNDAELGIEVQGLEALPIQDIKIRNMVVLNAEKTKELQHFDNLIFENVKINGRFIEPVQME